MSVKAYPVFAVLLALFATGCGSGPVVPARDSGSSSSDAVEEVVGVQELRREVAELRNTVEVQRNELERLRERQRQLYDDLDYRLSQYEQGSGMSGQGNVTGGQQQIYGQTGQQPKYGEQGTSGTAGQDVYGQQGIARENETQNETQGSGSQGGQSDAEQSRQLQSASARQAPETTRQDSPQQVVASTEEQAAYDSAFELLKQSRYNDAIMEFRSMVSQFPNGALVDDAHYWIGEAYYVTRNFNSALGAFETVVNQYPDSQRVPEALLKLGYVQAELGQTQRARQTLNQVISRYPGSRVAISAETRLSRIR